MRVAELFSDANLRYKTPDDIKKAIWKKYIFISAFATITSYYDKPIGYIYEHHYEDAKKILMEIANVAKCNGIDIYDEIDKSLNTAKNLPYKSSTAMQLDYKNGRKVELESLSGYIVKEATLHNLKVPLMETFYEKLYSR